ncbi:PIG-L family deacetylase [Micromonospora sp. R77]|uniref:PIG-L deacetylase family protein n=1 Tax=Micromonospora sp. R77 TaxID=2925836 RepID=UPI001F6109D6|nr:PIG-L deacetylase family protein [Micromonospora sp. R77]MCI4065652.1 PIG-L family deacetylase [Micromonospora sp. R77]
MPIELPDPTGRAGLRVLAIGAHPDDVEIGAAALVTKLREQGHEVYVLVLTDDPACCDTRRAEATNAAAEMGVPADRVHFGGVEQGYLRGDIDEVRLVRELMARLDLRPDVVVTHTWADSHNDHGAAYRIAHAAFRDCVFLHYSTHVSSEISHFRPTVFVEVTPDRLLVKDRALKCYHSQASRIGRHDLTAYEELHGRRARLDRAEAFEVGLQYGATDAARRTVGLSDSPFHRFWLPAVGDGTVTLLYEPPADGDTPATSRHRNAARDALRQAFVDLWSPYPLREHCADADEASAAARRGSVVTVGGPDSNPVARECQRLDAPVWTLSSPRCLENRVSGARLAAGAPREFGYVARRASPWAAGATVVGVAGVSDAATRAGMEFLADPGRAPEVARIFDEHPWAQVVYGVEAGELRVVDVQPSTADGGDR